MNAWPALNQALIDGWVLRFAGGHTKRANSITPLYDGRIADLDAKISLCERIYAGQRLPPIFRLTSFATPPGLDDALARRGYGLLDATGVMRRTLGAEDDGASSRLTQLGLADWLPLFCKLSRVDPATHGTHGEMLGRIVARTCFAALDVAGVPAAVGLGVLEGHLFGLFDVVTDLELRRRGHGAALVRAMMAWALTQGATDAYLQVVETNTAARRLYRKLGFTESYRYWYRMPSVR